MRSLVLLLFLAGCAQSGKEDTQKCCMERIGMFDVLKYGRVVNGQTVATCNHWCVGKNVGRACGCQITCSCKD